MVIPIMKRRVEKSRGREGGGGRSYFLRVNHTASRPVSNAELQTSTMMTHSSLPVFLSSCSIYSRPQGTNTIFPSLTLPHKSKSG